jgi:signal transduction histidine kinase
MWLYRASVYLALVLAGFSGEKALYGQPSAQVTNVSQIRLLATQTPETSYSIHLEGDVWWANPSRDRFVLKDDSGAEELEMDLQGISLKQAHKIRITGDSTITPTGAGFRLGAKGPVVDNDGVHSMVEKSGAVFLRAGLNPLCVEWFNGVEKYGLTVEYQGPDLPRQKIPDSALFRFEPAGGSGGSNRVNGLDFICSEVSGEILPDFNPSTALKTGTVSNFDLRVMTRPEHVGLCFTGFLDVPRDGLYTFYTTSDDGSLLFVGKPSLQLTVIGPASYPKPRPLTLGQTLRPGDDRQWVEVKGKATFVAANPDGLMLELSAGTGRLRVVVADGSDLSPALLLNRRIRATGFCQSGRDSDHQEVPGVLLVPGSYEIEVLEPHPVLADHQRTNAAGLPLLLSAGEIHRLKREEAQRGYPVNIRGVVTSVLPEHQAFTFQDSSRGIYVIDYSESRSDSPRIGEFLEVEGVTEAREFAPIVNASHVRSLGIGHLPEPIRPTRDQLMNGSLDAQYVEIQGVPTSVQPGGVTLLTPDFRIKAELRVNGLKPPDIKLYEDALIRVRGCLFATWDYVTHQVRVGEIRINGADITVDQPAPADLFSTARKAISDLFLFDPQASVFQRVQVSGQIIHIRDTECFMMDGHNGVRFVAKHPADLQVGDLVDVVGFPELSVVSPVLREAVARKTGHAALPNAKFLNADDLTRAGLDSTLVRVKATLADQRTTSSGQILEMRISPRSFVARLQGAAPTVQGIPSGSQLDLTGTYASQGVGPDFASFELLLNGPADIAVLARPPWWTLEKLLVMLGALACVLAVTVLWITQLSRKVEQRTAELEVQIQQRQRVEQQHAMEQERARIARDLHDDLGSGLTEITMLGARARTVSAPVETRSGYLEQMCNKARQMVSALDEIVWAMNPTHDSFASMVTYFSLYAERFLGLANISWQLEGPTGPDDRAVNSRHRHQLFLAFKEALTNIVRHSGASQVRLKIQVERDQVCLTVTDNGRGGAGGGQTDQRDGVTNMRARLEKLGGRFEIKSQAGQGTTLRMTCPCIENS